MAVSQSNNLKKETHVDTSTSSPNIVTKEFSKEEAETAIRKYFNLLDFRDYEGAFGLLSIPAQERISFAEWKDGYKNTLAHEVQSLDCADFVCNVDVLATENTKEDLRRTKYRFKYFLIYDGNDASKIDRLSFVSQTTIEIIENHTTSTNSDPELFSSIVKILCTDPNFEYISQGSGTVITETRVLSNMHVSLGYPEYCIVMGVDKKGILSDTFYTVSYSMRENEDYDFWTFELSSSTPSTLKPLPILPCTEDQTQIGDSIRIYGFPSVSGENLTVTEGLLSGIESRVDGFYVTSAKIDHGNSGGTAIDTTKNCFLGVPTVGLHGELESYGGILSISKILEIIPSLFYKPSQFVQ